MAMITDHAMRRLGIVCPLYPFLYTDLTSFILAWVLPYSFWLGKSFAYTSAHGAGIDDVLTLLDCLYI